MMTLFPTATRHQMTALRSCDIKFEAETASACMKLNSGLLKARVVTDSAFDSRKRWS